MKFFSNLRRRGLALFLVLTMCMTLLPAQAMAAEKTDGTVGEVSSTDENVKVTKTAEPKSGTDKATITMEAYVNGKATTTSTTTHTPLDIVLVLDQSGSMEGKNLTSLKNALNGTWNSTGFLANILNDAKENEVDHRIAVVGYASDNSSYNRNRWENTGLYVGGQFVKYGSGKQSTSSLTDTQYTQALVSVNSNGQIHSDITNSIARLATYGYTKTYYGLKMAGEVFRCNPVTSGESRQRVVLLFTDGATDSDRNDVLTEANTLKSQYNATVYTVALGASGENEFLQHISSNYTTASHHWYYGYTGTQAKDESGQPITKYSMTANSSSELENIFQSFSEDITTIAPAVEVTEEAVLKDQLSAQFTFDDSVKFENGKVIEGVTVYSVAAKGTGDAPEWDNANRKDITNDVSIEVTGSAEGKTIQVVGFDYSDEANFVVQKDDKWQGHKLVFVFDVKPDTSYEGWGETGAVSTNLPGASLEQGEDVKVEVKDPSNPEYPGTPSITVPTYTVGYSWSNAPTGTVYDADGNVVTLNVPSDSKYYISGQTYTSLADGMTVYTHDEYGNQNGSYTLTWDGPEGTTINGANVSYTGTWGYMGLIVGTANVTFTTSDGGKVVNGMDAEGANTYGDVTDSGLVNRPFPTTAPATEAEAGYHFVGWKVTGADDSTATLTPTWPEKVDQDYSYTAVFEENTKHTVSYSWTGLPETHYNSDSLTDTTPAGLTAPADQQIAEGVKYTVDSATYGPVYTHGTNADGSIYVNGKYVFSGWNDSGEKTMGNQDVSYTGSWTDVTGNPVDPTDPEKPEVPGLPKYDVTYKVEVDRSAGFYPSDEARAQMAGITEPVTDSDTYFLNQDVTLKTVDPLSVADTVGRIVLDGKVENPGVSGTWVFSGWKLDGEDAQSTEKMAEGGLTFTGVWTFTRNPVYTVKYFQQNASGGYDEVLADRVLGTGAAGTEVAAEVKTYEGFELNMGSSTTSGTIIAQDNGLILELYYDRTAFTVTYTIEGDTHGAVAPEKQTYKFGDAVTVADVLEVPGYTFNGWNGTEVFVDGKMPAKDVVLTGSFEAQNLYYEVQYLDKETGEEIINSERVMDVTVGDAVPVATIAAANKDKCNGHGYMYDSADPAAQLIISADYSKNVIKLYYQKVTCTVEFYSYDNGQMIAAPVTISGLTPGTKYDAKAIETLALSESPFTANMLKDYTYADGFNVPLTIAQADNVVRLFYTKQPSYSYTVYYMEEGTTTPIADPVTETFQVKVGDKIDPDSYRKNISGYTFKEASPADWIVNDGKNTFILYYTKNTSTSYTVNYYYQGEAVPFSSTYEPNAVVGALIPVDEAPAGYKLVEATGPLHVVEGSDNIVNVYYAKRTDLGYTVKYYKDMLLDDESCYLGELPGQGTLGEEIKPNRYAYVPNGYPVPGEAYGQMTITANEAENVVKVLYTKDSVTYNYRILYWQDSVDGTPLGSIPATSAVPVERVILTNEQLNAKKPSVGDYKDGVQVSVDKDQNVINVVYTKANPDPDKYTVTYEWTTDSVPQDVYLPIDTNAYAEGAQFTVDGKYKAGDKKVVYERDDDSHLYEAGAYVFSGWKLDGEVVDGNQIMGSSNVVLKGAWTWEKANTYKVTYEWANGKAPAEARLPAGAVGLYTGNRFTVADEPDSIDRIVNGVKLGTWVFLGWIGYKADTDYTMLRNDVVISGEWEYIPVEVNTDDHQDLRVTKTSDDQNVSVGDTVTWIIEIENTRDDITYSGLSLEEYLTGVYGEEALTGGDLRISGEYYRSIEDPYFGFGAEAVTLPDAVEVPTGEETTEPAPEPEEDPEKESEEDSEEDSEQEPDPETMQDSESEPEFEPEFGPEVPAAFNPDTTIMSRGFIHFAMYGYDDIDAGMSVETADWRNFNLGPNDRVVFVVEYTVQDGDQNLKNQVTVTRGNETLGSDTAEDVTVQEPDPSVTVEKTPVVPENGYVAGNDVQWIITVTNNTKYPVTGLSLEDTLTGVTVDGTLDYTNFDLAAEGKATFTATLANAPAGTYTNAVVVSKDAEELDNDTADEVKVNGVFTVIYTDGVSGTAFATQTYSNCVEGTATPAFIGTPTREGYVFTGWSPAAAGTVTGDATYTAQWVSATVPTPSFTVVKTVDRTTASVGDVITYTITVTNNGNVDLTNIVVSDPMMENGSTTIESLPVGGEPVVFTYTHTVTLAEAGTTLRNTVTVTGTNPNPGQEDPDPDEDTVDTEITPVPEVPPIVIPTPPTGGVTIPDGPTPLAPGGDTILDDEVPLAAPGLNSTDHFDYVKGYEDGTVRPEANITRAEVATIFFRLMTNEYRMENWSTENSFSDVTAGTWYNNAISTATKAGILTGYPEGDFRPEKPITRAEFASLAARFASEEVTQRGRFSDIQGHWAEENIERAAAAGWIKGENGKFRPEDYITRAEVITTVNRMLDRVPDADHLLDGMKTFVDNVPGMWYYADVQEATNSHDYERDETGINEIWTELKPDQDWTALEKEWADAAAANVADVAANLNDGNESEGETEGEAETESEAKTED